MSLRDLYKKVTASYDRGTVSQETYDTLRTDLAKRVVTLFADCCVASLSEGNDIEEVCNQWRAWLDKDKVDPKRSIVSALGQDPVITSWRYEWLHYYLHATEALHKCDSEDTHGEQVAKDLHERFEADHGVEHWKTTLFPAGFWLDLVRYFLEKQPRATSAHPSQHMTHFTVQVEQRSVSRKMVGNMETLSFCFEETSEHVFQVADLLLFLHPMEILRWPMDETFARIFADVPRHNIYHVPPAPTDKSYASLRVRIRCHRETNEDKMFQSYLTGASAGGALFLGACGTWNKLSPPAEASGTLTAFEIPTKGDDQQLCKPVGLLAEKVSYNPNWIQRAIVSKQQHVDSPLKVHYVLTLQNARDAYFDLRSSDVGAKPVRVTDNRKMGRRGFLGCLSVSAVALCAFFARKKYGSRGQQTVKPADDRVIATIGQTDLRISEGERFLFYDPDADEQQTSASNGKRPSKDWILLQGKHDEAIKYFKEQLSPGTPPHPEVLIYLLNALVRRKAAKTPGFQLRKVAVVAPGHSHVELLHGIAQAQLQINIEQQAIAGVDVSQSIKTTAYTATPAHGTPVQSSHPWGLVVVIADDSDEPELAGKVSKRLAIYGVEEHGEHEQIVGIIGHFGSNSTKTALQNYQEGPVCISPTSTVDDLWKQDANGWFFRTVPPNNDTARMLAAFMAYHFRKPEGNPREISAMAVYAGNGTYGSNLKTDFWDAFKLLKQLQDEQGNAYCHSADDDKISYNLSNGIDLQKAEVRIVSLQPEKPMNHKDRPKSTGDIKPNAIVLLPNVPTRATAQLLMFDLHFDHDNKARRIFLGGDSAINQFTLFPLAIPGDFYAALSWLPDGKDQRAKGFINRSIALWHDKQPDTWRMVNTYEATRLLGGAIGNLTDMPQTSNSVALTSIRKSIRDYLTGLKDTGGYRMDTGRTRAFDNNGDPMEPGNEDAPSEKPQHPKTKGFVPMKLIMGQYAPKLSNGRGSGFEPVDFKDKNWLTEWSKLYLYLTKN